MISLEEIKFNEILPYWRDRLWPDRISPIEPASSMLYLGGYDITIKYFNQPTFFAIKVDGLIVGVNSGHQTSDTDYRSRGIWVDPDFKMFGNGRRLIDAAEVEARRLGCNILWSCPRQSALSFYLRCGFKQTSEFDNEFEFGPNCYAMKELTT